MASSKYHAAINKNYERKGMRTSFVEKSLRISGVALLSLLALLMPNIGTTQTVNGSFRGTVSDPSGAHIPGALVKATNVATGVTRQTITNLQGSYVLTDIPPGAYDFAVSYRGFATEQNRGVTLLVNQVGTLDFVLKPGGVKQEVTVTAQAPLANLVNATVGTVVGSRQVVQLPLNGRQFTQLILLTPGASPQGSGQQGSWEVHSHYGAISPAVNGARSEMNNFTIDGVQNNELFFNFPAINPPPDAIQEFNVQSNMSSAQYGQAAGANVNVVTKSGGNELHGDAWEFLRNTSLDARNFFSPAVSVYHQNQFGGTLGGPIRKNKIWGFGWYEGFRSSLGSTLFAQVPTAAQLNGDLSGFPQIFNPFSTRQVGTDAQGNPIFARDPFTNNQIPSSLLNPTALAIAKLRYPQPNFTSSSGLNFLNSQPNVTNTDQFGIRIDAALSQKTSLFGRFARDNSYNISPSSVATKETTLNQVNLQQVLGLTHTLSPTTVLDLRAQFLRTNLLLSGGLNIPPDFLESNGILQDWPANTGLPALLPSFSLSDVNSIPGGTFSPAGGPINNWQYTGSVSKIAGNHTLNLGASVMRTWVLDNCTYESAAFNQEGSDDPQNPSATGSGLASFLLGVPTSAQRLAGTAEMTYQLDYYGLFADDTWKVTPKLTVSLGLRYDYSSPMVETKGRAASIDFFNSTPTQTVWLLQKQANPPLVDLSASPLTIRRVDSLILPDRDNLAPRLALAYRLGHAFAVRTGYGIFYDFNQSNVQDSQDIMGQWPFGFSDFTPSDLNTPTASQPTPQHLLGAGVFPPFVPSVTPPPGIGNAIDPHTDRPYVQIWDFGIDKSYGNNWLISGTYVGSKGTHLVIKPSVNAALTPGPGPITPRATLPQFDPFAMVLDLGNSNYQALELKAERRFSNGLSFLASYTYSKSIDEQSDAHGSPQAGESNPRWLDIAANRAVSDYDLPQNFVFNYIYALPFGEGTRFSGGGGWLSKYLFSGWQTTGILTLHSGFPFGVPAPFDVANTGASGQRPWLTGSLYPAGFQQNLQEWFNTNAFSLAPYTYGNMGRNILRQDGMKDFDFGLFKETRITERMNMQFRAEFFNLFNYANFGHPNVSMNSPSFGTVSSAGNPRFIQFGLKFMF